MLRLRLRLLLETVGDLVGHHDGDVVAACRRAEERPSPDEHGRARGHRAWARPATAAAGLELGAEVGGDGVDDDEAYAVALDRDGELVAEDVVLALEVGDLDAEDAGEGRLLRGGQRGQDGVVGEELG